jgi:hypothetical protein
MLWNTIPWGVEDRGPMGFCSVCTPRHLCLAWQN